MGPGQPAQKPVHFATIKQTFVLTRLERVQAGRRGAGAVKGRQQCTRLDSLHPQQLKPTRLERVQPVEAEVQVRQVGQAGDGRGDLREPVRDGQVAQACTKGGGGICVTEGSCL